MRRHGALQHSEGVQLDEEDKNKRDTRVETHNALDFYFIL